MDKSLEIAFKRFEIEHLRENVIIQQSDFISGKYSYCTNKFHLDYPSTEKIYPFLAHHVAAMIKQHPNTRSILQNERRLIHYSSILTIASLFFAPKFKKTSIGIGLTSVSMLYFSHSLVIFHNQISGMVSGIKKMIEHNDYESLAGGSLYVPDSLFKTSLFLSGHTMNRQYDEVNDKIVSMFSPLLSPSQKVVVSVKLDDE
jgi:hypothetical protein